MVFTDGISTDLDDLKEQAAALKLEATVYAFGIGSEINIDELEVFFVNRSPIKYLMVPGMDLS